jgi:hypothetical protein
MRGRVEAFRPAVWKHRVEWKLTGGEREVLRVVVPGRPARSGLLAQRAVVVEP